MAVPRAAVSTVVRCAAPEPVYALIQRGKPPNKGVWSLPGGKVESGEAAVVAARRELVEETQLADLRWHGHPFTTSDAILPGKGGDIAFHYLIAQCFAEVAAEESDAPPPALVADDDAMDARWWSLDDIRAGVADGKVTPGVERVVERAEALHAAGLLKTA